jgi:hypothetical protein
MSRWCPIREIVQENISEATTPKNEDEQKKKTGYRGIVSVQSKPTRSKFIQTEKTVCKLIHQEE